MRVTDSPYYFPARMQAALILEQAKQYTEALAILEDVTPTTIEQVKKVVVLQSTIYIETNQLEEAYLLSTKLLVLLPEDKDLLYLRSQIALGLQQEESAETDLTQLLKQEPDNVEVLNTLGYLLLNNKDRLEEARTYLLKALSLSPEDPDILDSVGWMYFQQADFSKALTYLSSAYAKEPNNAEIAAHYGEALWESGHQEKAKNIWKKALQNEPNNATLLKIMERVTAN
jgi:tetratricopeptide (TPR) repeat protein